MSFAAAICCSLPLQRPLSRKHIHDISDEVQQTTGTMADPQSREGCLQNLTGAREARLSCEMPSLAADFLRPSHNQQSFLSLVTPYKGQVASLINTTLTVQDDSQNPLQDSKTTRCLWISVAHSSQ